MDKKRKRSSTDVTVQRLSSNDAAGMILQHQQQLKSDTTSPLLVITTDASGDGACSGLAAILRRIGHSDDGDVVKVVLDRLQWDESSVAEVAAVSVALNELLASSVSNDDKEWAKFKILIISDCETVLQFYTQQDDDGNHVRPLLEDVVGVDDWRDTINRVLTGTNEAVYMSRVRSTHSKNDGFFDHAAADLFSAMARNQDRIDQFQKRCYSGCWKKKVPPLREQDLDWLKQSGIKGKKKNGGSEKRKARCKDRIENDLNIPATLVNK